MSKTKRTLNLDELFGAAKDLIVLWGDRQHTLRHPTSMGPADVMKLQQLQAAHAALTAEDGEALEGVVSEIIAMIAPTLASQNLPFFAKMRILTFYEEELKAEAPPASPKAAAGGSLTGATSTAS
jgi:hypothetical protein